MQTDATTKRCPRCTQTLSMEAFARCASRADGRQVECRACRAVRQQAYYALHASEIRARQRLAYQADLDCAREKARVYAAAWRAAHPERARAIGRRHYAKGGRERAAAWRVGKAEMLAQRKREYYAHDPEKFRRQALEYAARHPERVKTRHRRWMEDHREHVRAYENAHRADKSRRSVIALRRRLTAMSHEERKVWYRAHYEQVGGAWKMSLWRAKKAGAVGHWTPQDRAAMEIAQAGLCFYCGKPYGRYHVEHKVPLSRGGANDPTNLCLSCARCNSRKGRRTPEEFQRYLAAR